jgi:hypothetical protein
VALHADGGRVATGGEDCTVRVWNARTREAEHVLAGHEGEVTALAFTPDGRFLLSSSRDHTVRVWDLRPGASVRTLPHPALVLGLALTPVGTTLLTAGGDHCVRVWHLDWEPDTAGTTAAAAALPTTRVGGATVRTRVAEAVRPARRETLREDLRRVAPVPVPSLPQAARAARRLPWGRFALGLVLVASIAAGWLAWRRPAVGPRVSPYMAQAVPKEVDLVDLAPFRGDCSPGDYERHLERMRTGNPDGRDVACLAAQGTPGVVADVLDGAPLTSPDALAARRLRRNAASALAGLPGDAVATLCERLEDERAEVRSTVALALGVMAAAAVVDCVRSTLVSGSPPAQSAAASALRQQAARGLVKAAEAWSLVEGLLQSPEPQARMAGLHVAEVFTATTAEPAIRGLLGDTDPDVAAAARQTLDAVEGLHRTDLLRGDTGS